MINSWDSEEYDRDEQDRLDRIRLDYFTERLIEMGLTIA